ncbi:MAG: 4-alpha-glucanotransferase [Gemmatimonas sp.]
MKFPRASGILLHPTSLPGPGGIGTLGPDALGFVKLLADTRCSIWQMLPLGPTGYGDSPYQCFSAFAGNPLLISLPAPAESLTADGVDVDFGAVISEKRLQLRKLFERFVPDVRYERWVQQQTWLEDFALFSVLKAVHHGHAWTSWAPALAAHDLVALATFATAHTRQLEQIRFEQYVFFRQFQALKQACTEHKIKLMGDVPIYVAHDSADVWSNRELFDLDEAGGLITQAGVPPDYFSDTGQLWGNPIYKWETLKEQGYQWWIDRMRSALSMFDIVRLDHFRGFEAYWEVPGNATTAVNGRWMPGPGASLFTAMTEALGPLPIVAENLGLITPEVEALREQFGYPGMSILQFAFGGAPDELNEFRPHLYPQERVVYTGTHDNDTTMGWWNSEPGAASTRSAADIEREHAFARRYLDTDGREMNWTLIRAALASVADTVLVPMQDILGLGSEARMNLPGRQAGNWKFRFDWSQLTPDLTRRLRELNTLFDR